MAVPDYQSLMLPLLRVMADGQDHNTIDLVDTLAAEFQLTNEDRTELIPSGVQTKFENRVVWARTYMRKAGLVDSLVRGRWQITKRGLEVLSLNPPMIDNKYLMQYSEFREFKNLAKGSVETGRPEVEETVLTPVETLEASYQSLRRELAQDLLERARKCSPRFFEKLVVDLLVSMGYGGSRKDAGQAIGRSGDEGVDGVIKEDRLGLDVVYVQAKRWGGTVGRKEVQSFAGSLMGLQADKGVFITTSQFSQDATAYVSKINKKIVLIDGEQLAQYMIDHDVGVTEVTTYIVKKMDLDYFDEQG